MRVFLDANVIVSGLAFPGNANRILRSTFSARDEFVSSEDVRNEVLDVLVEKFPSLSKEASEALSLLPLLWMPRRSYTASASDYPGLRDPEDAHVLGAATAAGCDLLVTGDKDLLSIGKVRAVRIVSPATAWVILQMSHRE